MDLEKMINSSNEYYINHDIAYIYKKPIPIKIVEVSYPCRKKAIITKAFYSTPSTTDYNGIYKGFYIDFEAKETQSKTSFALSNIHNHQLNHLNNISNHNGIAFIIIRFCAYNEIYILEHECLKNYLINTKTKSLPYKWIIKNAHLIKEKFSPTLDYLKVIDNIIEKRYCNEF